jgi:hypothetical protein
MVGLFGKRRLSADDIRAAFTELGKLAALRGESVELLLVGGSAMVLGYQARDTTFDVDAVWDSSASALVRTLAAEVAARKDWPTDWLNDGAKGYLTGFSPTQAVVFSAEGLLVRVPDAAQLLAMKLSAWRNVQDRSDASVLLRAARTGSREDTWNRVEPYLVVGRELKAQCAFEQLWEEIYAQDDD